MGPGAVAGSKPGKVFGVVGGEKAGRVWPKAREERTASGSQLKAPPPAHRCVGLQ